MVCLDSCCDSIIFCGVEGYEVVDVGIGYYGFGFSWFRLAVLEMVDGFDRNDWRYMSLMGEETNRKSYNNHKLSQYIYFIDKRVSEMINYEA